ncbi:serine/threonine-protein kinase [Amycolatopsis anabasis]|uniref:serine/threonine-protein kinase n=1 Tax=Amycolatopsis anabasis TaxID=1840409 RepID=UPI00131A7651|nr:serine/threonine-protein kinase [Amycolatopsis anabasis]
MKPLNPGENRQVGRYRVLAALGEGGMGRVLLAVSADGRLVALKQVHSQFANDDGFRTRFRREVEASRMVSGAYTAAVMDADPDAPLPWLASVFVAGPSLHQAVAAAGPLPVPTVRYLAAGLASALTEIHRVGLIHRDLKPSNVLLTEDGPRVIDFGIARATEGDIELTHAGSVIGSPGFMSPEQAESKTLTPASDVFSLGALLVMASTGRSPFSGASAPQTLYNVVHSQPELDQAPPEVRQLAEPCLAKDPAQRPTPDQILDFLGPVSPGANLWPPIVQSQIAQQKAEVQAVLNGPVAPEPQPQVQAQAWAQPNLTMPQPPPAKQSNTAVKVLLAIIAAIVLVGGTAVTVIMLNKDGSPSSASPASGASSSAPAPTTDPLSIDKLRRVDPCKVLPADSVPALGNLTPDSGSDLGECDYTAANDVEVELNLGDELTGGGSDEPPAQIEGLPVTIDKRDDPKNCDATVPIFNEKRVGITVTGRVQSGEGCETARAALTEVVKRLRANPPEYDMPSGSLIRVDPCSLIDKASMEQIIGVVSEMAATGLHECDWDSKGLFALYTDRGSEPDADDGTPIDLGGTPAFQELKQDREDSASCGIEWLHRKSGDDAETVRIFYTVSGDAATAGQICQQAQAVAKAIIPKLPKP